MNLEAAKKLKMSPRTAPLLAWTMCALSLALTALSLMLFVLNLSHPSVHTFDYWAEYTVTAIAGSTVGAIIASRRPDNPIGWIFCTGGGLTAAGEHFGAEYSIFTLLSNPGSIPGGEAAAWITSWMWTLPVGLFVFLCLLFPSGQLLSSRWRWVAWLSGTAVLMGAVGVALQPGPIDGLGPIQNPLGLRGINLFRTVGNDDFVQALLGGLGFVATGSLFVRLRRAQGEERQQLKWFVYAATVLASGIILAYTVSRIVNIPWLTWVGFILVITGAVSIQIAVGVAILKHRLYDIDVIVHRTMVYGSITLMLALFYFGSVAALQYVFGLLTGEGNTLAIVASTLGIATLFNPLRRRVQSFIDQRFYRRKYDAARTLEEFGIQLRDETDLDRISEELVAVIIETIQPAYVSLWLRPTPEAPSITEKQD